jgi:ferredoxin
VTNEPGWPENLFADTIFNVNIEDQDPIRAKAGEPLMNSLERYSVFVQAVYRTVACSVCRVKLISGKVFMPTH